MAIRASIKRLFRPARAIILMYHRIAEPEVDPWQLSVSRNNFAGHLEVLSKMGKVISLDQLIEDINNRTLKKNSICITFDDGYEDNYLYALPLIEKFGCPATFFIATGTINSTESYWWDILSDIFLTTESLPPTLDIAINNKQFSYQLENEGRLTMPQLKQHRKWHYPVEPPTQRSKIYLELWTHLRDMPSILISDIVNRLMAWSGVGPRRTDGNFPMSRHQLITMAESKFAGIGMHTVTHSALAAFPKQIQEVEITGSKEYLDGYLNSNHQFIAYPYGNYNADTLEVVKSAGIKAACTTDAKHVTVKSELHQLGRYQVINQSRELFSHQLKTWFHN